jgi:hypothetical protein
MTWEFMAVMAVEVASSSEYHARYLSRIVYETAVYKTFNYQSKRKVTDYLTRSKPKCTWICPSNRHHLHIPNNNIAAFGRLPARLLPDAVP